MLNIIGNLLHPMTVAYADWRARQRAYAELATLDDRSLADIGLTRSDIPYVLSHSAVEAPSFESAPAGNLRHAA
jgi:uncharacterized protein YjiS (DUF1127 family)